MSLKSHVIGLSTPALALAAGACLALAGCGGGSSPNASGGSQSSPASSQSAAAGSTGAACAAFSADYKKFLNGYAPPESQTGTDESPLQALSSEIAKINASGQLENDLAQLGIDSGLIATGSTEGGQTTPPSAFNTDLQAVSKDCGTTFAQPPAHLIQEG
jgi:hypothetical protein